MTWLDDWWGSRISYPDGERFAGHEELDPPDPGMPAQYGTGLGEPTVHPWSAVMGALDRLPTIVNLRLLEQSAKEAYQKANEKARAESR